MNFVKVILFVIDEMVFIKEIDILFNQNSLINLCEDEQERNESLTHGRYLAHLYVNGHNISNLP